MDGAASRSNAFLAAPGDDAPLDDFTPLGGVGLVGDDCSHAMLCLQVYAVVSLQAVQNLSVVVGPEVVLGLHVQIVVRPYTYYR